MDVDADNIVISKLIKTKKSSKYLIGYLDGVITPLVLMLPKIWVSGYVKTFANKNSRLMSISINGDKLLEK